MFSGKGIKIFRIMGIDIELDLSWFIIFGFFAWMFSSFYEGDFLLFKILVGAFTAILFFASVLFHELSHSFVAKLHGIKVSSITLWILGGMAKLSRNTESPGQEFSIAIVGPIASVLAGIFFYVVSFLVTNPDLKQAIDNPASLGLFGSIFLYLGFINILLAVFNMIPAYPLDGGRVLRSILWKRWGDTKRAARTSSVIGKYFGWLIIAAGLAVFLLAGSWNGLWFILMGWFLKDAAEQSWIGHLLELTTVRDVMGVVKKGVLPSPVGGIFVRQEIQCSMDDNLKRCMELMGGTAMNYIQVVENNMFIDFLYKEEIFDYIKQNRI